MKLGIDLVSASRFKKIRKTDYRHWQRVFTPKEWAYAFKDVHFAEHLAGIFAAKEAAMKTAGVAGPGHFLDWEVRHKKSGQPEIIYGRGKKKVILSIGHDADLAIAVAAIL